MKAAVLILVAVMSLTGCVVVNERSNPVPVTANTPNVNKNAVYVCSITPFNQSYHSENTNRGRAKLDVQKQCLAKNHEMFCKEQDIQCSEYQ